MAEFYPSEIARLVLGYLKEIKCLEAWQVFLDECIDLQEHKRLYKEGKFCSTNVNGKSLLDILAEYCFLKNASKESNQNKCSTNTYQVYGVYKTPSKNEGAFTSYSINQRIQTRSVVSAHKSPRYNLFRSPTSRPHSQTPRRRLECQTTLNFGSEAQTSSENNLSNINANANEQLVFISSSNTQTCNRSPQFLKGNVCSSSPGVATCSNIQDGKGEVHSSHNGSETITNYSENYHSFSTNQSKTPNDIASQVTNVSERGAINFTSDITHSESSELNVDKQRSSITVMCDTAVSQSSVKNIVCRSSEITTNIENASLNSPENCSTPQYEVEPPPYNRAPNTNSPRIVLSHDRSLIPSLTTPNKDKKWPEEEWSPKRKGTVPRRRLISESPSSKYIQHPEAVITFDSVIENLFGTDETLYNDPLVQLLTENINKVKQSEFKEESDILEGLDDLVKKAAVATEEDPALEKFFAQMCGNSRDCIDNVEYTPSKLSIMDCDREEMDWKETNETEVISEPNEETKQNSANDCKSGSCQNPTVQETEKLNSDTQSLNTFKSNLDSSIADLDNNCEVPSGPQQILNTDIDTQLNSNTKNSLSDDNKSSSNNLNNLNNITPDLSVDDNFEKNPQSREISSVISVDNDICTTMTDTVNDSLLKSKNLNNTEAEKPDTAEENQNTASNTQNSLEPNNHSNIVTSTVSESGPTIITPQLNCQPNALLEVSLPSLPAILMSTLGPDGTVQSNLYRFVINPPVFNPSTIAGIGLPLSTVPTQNITSPLTVTSTPAAPLLTVPTQNFTSPLIVTSTPAAPLLNVQNIGNNSTLPGNAENSVATPESSKTLILGVGSSGKKNLTPNEPCTSPPKKRQRTSKRQKSNVNYSEEFVISPPLSVTVKSNKKCNKKRNSKRKSICLFPNSPSSKTTETSFKTPVKDSETEFPVLSIPEGTSSSDQSSAFKLFSQITGNIERGDRSPVLKSLMSKAAILSDKKSRCNSSYVRCLDFDSDTNNLNKSNDSVDGVINNKTHVSVLNKSSATRRRSSRIQLQKEEMLKDSKVVESINVQQLKKQLKIDSADVSPLNNQIKNTESDNFNSPMFSKALDVFNCVDEDPNFDDNNHIEQSGSKETSNNLSNALSNNSQPLNQAGFEKKCEENQQEEIEIIELNDSDEYLNSKQTTLPTTPEKNNSNPCNLDLQQQKKQESKIVKKKLENDENSSEEDKNCTISKKSPMQCKDKKVSTARSNSPLVFLTKSRNSEFQTKKIQEKSDEKDKCNESPKSSTSLEHLLFGSDIDFTPEKDSNFVVQSSSIDVSPPSVSSAVVTTDINKLEMKNTSLTSKSKNISPKSISPNSKQSPKLDYACSPLNILNPQSGENISNLVNDNNESSFLSDNCLATHALQDMQQTEMANYSNEKKSNLLTSPTISTAIENTNLENNVPKKSSAVGVAAKKDKPIFKNKTPQKKSLESIISFCKEKERVEHQEISKTPGKQGAIDKFYRFEKMSAEKKLQTSVNQHSNISPIDNLNIHESRDRTQHTQVNSNSKSPSNKDINNLSQSPSVMPKFVNIQKNSALSPKNMQKEKCVSHFEQSIPTTSRQNGHSSPLIDNLTCNRNLPESVHQKVKGTVTLSVQDGKNVEATESFLTKHNPHIDLHSKKCFSIEKDTSQNRNNLSENSKVINVLPPPKKRIRPIPVDSSSNESFSSPFTQFLSSPKINKAACIVSAESSNKKEEFIKNPLPEPVCSAKTKEIPDEINNVFATESVPVCSTNSFNNISNKQPSIAKSPLTNFISPSTIAIPEIKRPSPETKPKSVSPNHKSLKSYPTFQQPSYYRSGKPRAMLEITRNANSKTVDELPISPVPFSNSSSTFDCFSAKRKLLEDSPSEFSKEVQMDVSLTSDNHHASNSLVLVHNKSNITQQNIVVEGCALEKHRTVSDNYKNSSLKTYSRSHLVKKKSATISLDKSFNDSEDDNSNLLNVKRKRKRSDSSCSDTCSTVVDSDGEIMTPVKSDEWLKKDLFRKSPVRLDKTRSISSSSSDLDTSPEKGDHLKNRTNLPPCKLNAADAETISISSTNINKSKNSSADAFGGILGLDVELSEKSSELNSRGSHSKKKKISPDKRGRRSRPTLKIASLNSPCKKKVVNDKTQKLSILSSKSSPKKRKSSSNIASKGSECYEKSIKKDGKNRNKITDANREVTEKNLQPTKAVSEKVIKSCTAGNQNSVISPKKSPETVGLCESTQDIVESDIGKSSDAGSELAIAIASCERELLNSQSDHCSQSSKYQPTFELDSSRLSPSKNQENTSEKQPRPFKMVSTSSKLDLIMDKIKMIDPEKLNNLLEKIAQDKE